MVLYILAAGMSIVFASVAVRTTDIKPDRPSWLFAFLSFLPLTAVSALRYQVGADWPIYDAYFHSINTGGKAFTEIGFVLLNKFVYLFSHDVVALTLVVSVLIGIFVFKAIFDQSVNAPISILMYVILSFYFISMNEIRQSLAIAIFLYAFKYICQRKPLHYFLLIALATSIHLSALVFIPVYFLYGRKINIKVMALIFVGLIIFLPLLNKLAVAVIEITKYSWYFGSVHDIHKFFLRGVVFGIVVVGLYLYYFYAVPDKNDNEYNLILMLQFISVLVLLFTQVMSQIQRISVSLSVVSILGVPKLLSREHRPKRRLVLYVLVFLLYSANMLYDVYSNVTWYGVIPYRWIFST